MMIDFVYLLHNKCNNLMFKTNNKTVDLPLCDVNFLAIN